MAAMYLIRDIRDSIVSEGMMGGKKAIEIVFGGCNHWDGDPSHRKDGLSACSMWCDANFYSYCSKKMTAEQIAERCRNVWAESTRAHRNPGLSDYVLLSGGEPLLFVDVELAEALRDHGFQLILATNGSMRPMKGLMELMAHVTVSPKLEIGPNGDLLVPDLKVCDNCELTVTLPGAVGGKGWTDEQLLQLEKEGTWKLMSVVPMDPTDPRTTDVTHLRGGYERHEELAEAVRRCLDWISNHRNWCICLQYHKLLNL